MGHIEKVGFQEVQMDGVSEKGQSKNPELGAVGKLGKGTGSMSWLQLMERKGASCEMERGPVKKQLVPLGD